MKEYLTCLGSGRFARRRARRRVRAVAVLAISAVGVARTASPAGGQSASASSVQQAQQSPPGGAQTPAAPPTVIAPLITQGVTFAPTMQFAKGQDRRYGAQSSLTFRFPGQNGAPSSFASTTTMTLTLRFRARETRSDGSVVVQALSEGGRLLDATGAFQNIVREPENIARVLTLDRLDRIVAFKDPSAGRAGGAGSGLDALFNQSNLLVPWTFYPCPTKRCAWASRGRPVTLCRARMGRAMRQTRLLRRPTRLQVQKPMRLSRTT